MESDLNKPAFTDERILKFFNKQWVVTIPSGHTYEVIRVGELNICLNLNLRQSPHLSLHFYSKNNDTIGCFTYNLSMNISSNELEATTGEPFFLETFNSRDSLMTRSAAIEKLMTYPDFKEWLLWNRP
jgi:hypothetical protein